LRTSAVKRNARGAHKIADHLLNVESLDWLISPRNFFAIDARVQHKDDGQARLALRQRSC
jgi:hypothetical protein